MGMLGHLELGLFSLLVVGIPHHIAAIDVGGVKEVAREGEARHVFHVDGDLVPLLASPNLVAGDRPTVVVKTHTKCTRRLDAFSCGADGEPDSRPSGWRPWHLYHSWVQCAP